MPPAELGDIGFEYFKYLREENYLIILSSSYAGGISVTARGASKVIFIITIYA
jgi:hypothetical protein